MRILILISSLLIFITSDIQADANPIPNDPIAEKKMAQKLKTQIKDEISYTQSFQAQRAMNKMALLVGGAMAAPAVKLLPAFKETPKPSEEMKKRTITMEDREKDKYAKPIF
jgi:hypothetical protein